MPNLSSRSAAALLPLAVLVLAATASAQEFLTGETGHRTGSNQNSQTATMDGGILLQDVYALEKLRRFNSERIAERVVHARGVAAMGTFRSAGDFSNLTAAHFLSKPNIATEIVVRFSTVIHGKHSPETLRDPRGFAIKFKTAMDGNWDLVGNNLRVFFIRDHIKFPDMVHSLKPDPITNIQDPNRFFDFFASIGGMATHMLTFLYSDLGIPKSYRFMEGNSVHAYKMVNAAGKVKYVKFRWFPHQGVKNLTKEEAAHVQGMDFNHATRDLNDAIMRGDSPKWDLAVQVMMPSQLDDFDFNPLDATKTWPVDQFPFTTIGTFELDRIPPNFHLGSEQVSYSPGNFLPGMIEPSEDRLLQGRLVSYHESQTHRHRSNNFQQLPINAPKSPVRNYNQDGIMAFEHAWKGSINFEPSMDANAYQEDRRYLYSTRDICGQYEQRGIEKTLDFRQAGDLYRSLAKGDQDNLIENLAMDLGQVRNDKVRNTMCAHFYKADKDYGMRISKAVMCHMDMVKKIAMKLED